MNIFLLAPSPCRSAEMLWELSPIRARKQLLECCQIIASAERIVIGDTFMLKKNGEKYKLAHPHHPIVRKCASNYKQLWLCVDVARALAKHMPNHACATSIHAWVSSYIGRGWGYLKEDYTWGYNFVVCRKGMPIVYVKTFDEYAALMLPYFMEKIKNA